MPLNIQGQQFPILQPGQMNPFHQALQQGIENQMNISKAAYAPLTNMANAASKLTYSGLMGPQFLAKLMQNEDFWGSLSEDQRNALTGTVFNSTGVAGGSKKNNAPASNQTATNAGTIENTEQPKEQPKPQQQDGFHQFMEWLSGTKKNSPIAQAQANPMQPKTSEGLSVPRLSNEDNMTALKIKGIDPNTQLGKAMLAVRSSPQFYAETQKEGAYPDYNDQEYLDRYEAMQRGQPQTQNQTQNQTQIAPEQQGTTAERVGKYKGIKEEEKALGQDRADAVKELGKNYEQAIKSEIPMKELIKITTNPTFVNMRNKIPAFQDVQLKALSKIGTKEEQDLIGQFKNYANQVVASTVTNFGGRILDKEITLAQNMKISDNDTIAEMTGKLKAAELINEMNKRGARLTSDIIQSEHISKDKAMEKAYKQLDVDKIKSQIDKELAPKATQEDIKYNAQKYGISENEVKDKLKKKGYQLEIKLLGEE